MAIESVVPFATAYKISTLLVGLASLYMGYRLFLAGIWGESGEVEASFKDNKLIIKRAAPGTFFALLGAGIICSTILMGFSYSSTQSDDGLQPVNLANNDSGAVRPVKTELLLTTKPPRRDIYESDSKIESIDTNSNKEK